uniref:Uncharacterized protein n=1 Tax=Anguilla anguilla TaxID=7936 RepID=A0A0E9RGF4_ANGAN
MANLSCFCKIPSSMNGLYVKECKLCMLLWIRPSAKWLKPLLCQARLPYIAKPKQPNRTNQAVCLVFCGLQSGNKGMGAVFLVTL